MQSPSAEEYKQILANYMPQSAVEGVYAFMNHYRVHLHITRSRRSKLGDYRWPQPRHNYEEISVNGDLNAFEFLWVILHEMAHLMTHQHFGNDAQPHGHEWQREYATLLLEYLPCFPPEVAAMIKRYASRIPLSHALGKEVENQLKRYTPGYQESATTKLDDLTPGTCFRIKARPEMLFCAVERRKTRWRCREVNSGTEYLVHGSAEVLLGD